MDNNLARVLEYAIVALVIIAGYYFGRSKGREE